MIDGEMRKMKEVYKKEDDQRKRKEIINQGKIGK